jgi:hypothetical protein
MGDKGFFLMNNRRKPILPRKDPGGPKDVCDNSLRRRSTSFRGRMVAIHHDVVKYQIKDSWVERSRDRA